MSSIRRKGRHTNTREDPPEDVESGGGGRLFSPAGAARRNPHLHGRSTILRKRKVVAHATNGWSERFGNLGEIIIGMALAFVVVGALIYLDHRGVIRMQSADNLRKIMQQTVLDPATIATIEETAGFKLLTVEEHDKMHSELESLEAQKKELLEGKVKQMEETDAKNKELAGVPEEYKTLSSNPLIELGRFCNTCEWHGTTCSKRAEEVAKADGIKRVAAKLKIIAEEAVGLEKEEPPVCSWPPGCSFHCILENDPDYANMYGREEKRVLSNFYEHEFKNGRNCKCN